MSLVNGITPKFKPMSDSEIMLYHMASFSDKDLIKKLQRFGIHIDKDSLGKLGEDVISLDPVYEILYEFVPEHLIHDPGFDWIYACVEELWKRWFPDRITYEKLRARSENVLGLLKHDNVSAAARVWYKSWPLFLKFFELWEIKSASDFCTRYSPYEEVLYDIALIAKRLADLGGPRHFLDDRISFCEEAMEALANGSEHHEVVHDIRCVLAQCYMTLDQLDKLDGLFMACLEKDETWDDGWFDWAEVYHGAGSPEHAEKSERILRDGIAVLETASAAFAPDVNDTRNRLLGRLAYVLEKQGRLPEAAVIRNQTEENSEPKPMAEDVEADQSGDTKVELTDSEKRLREKFFLVLKNVMEGNLLPKIGRSDPCPCDSGTKFKRCCGR